MEYSFLPLAGFAFVTSITPGPNNVMLASSGITFGFNKTVPYLLGMLAGFSTLLILSAAGLGKLMIETPSLALAVKIFGTCYMLYLAWGLRDNTMAPEAEEQMTPISFRAAFFFQFANPKGWIMALTSSGLFMPSFESYILSVIAFTLGFVIVGFPCSASWAVLGAGFRRILTNPLWQRLFSVVMILMIIYSAVAIWL